MAITMIVRARETIERVDQCVARDVALTSAFRRVERKEGPQSNSQSRANNRRSLPWKSRWLERVSFTR